MIPENIRGRDGLIRFYYVAGGPGPDGLMMGVDTAVDARPCPLGRPHVVQLLVNAVPSIPDGFAWINVSVADIIPGERS